MGNYASKKPIVKEDTDIDISYRKLSSLPLELTQEIYHYTHLLHLNASNNLLAALIGISRLSTLRSLNLEHNNVKELEEDLIQLTELQQLNVSHNNISAIPEEIRCLKNLIELKCNNNQITSVSSEIYHLSNLTHLNLAHNQLDIFPIEISLLAQLTHLDLYANRIPTIPSSALAQCKHLLHLNLSHNALRELPAHLFDDLRALTKLYVSHNQIKQLPNLDRLVSLKELDVSYNRLERIPQLKQKLTFLDVSSNPATASSSSSKPPPPKEKTLWDEPVNLSAEPEKGKRLFHILGSTHTRCITYLVDPGARLPDMGYYLLDNDTSLLLWETHRVSDSTKEAAIAIAKEYAKEVNVTDITIFRAEYPGDFWKQLNMQNPFAKTRSPLPTKKDYYLEYLMCMKLFCIGEDTKGDVHFDLQAGKRPYHYQLKSNYCYVLDCGWDIFVWAGEESSQKQRQHALLKADELMDYPRIKFSCIQWQFEGEETILFKDQFLNWDETVIEVQLPEETTSSNAKDTIKKRHASLVKPPDADFGKFPEIKIVPSKKPQKRLKVDGRKQVERPPTPEKAQLVPAKTAQKEGSLLSYAQRPSIPKQSRAPSSNPIRDRQIRHLAHEKAQTEKTSPRSAANMFGGSDDWKKVQLKTTGVALYGADEGRNTTEAVGPRLVQFQGRRSFLGKRLQPINTSIVLGSAYLLDTGKHGKIYIWGDKTASRTARGAALALAKALKDKERPDSLVTNIEVSGDDTAFWNELGGKIDLDDIPVDEAESETTSRDHISLHKVRNAQDGFQLTTEASGSIKRELLLPTGVYILDAETEIYIWFGKNATKTDRDAGVRFAEVLAQEKGQWCAPISKEFESSEQVLFKEKFIDWGGSIPISMQAVPVGINVAPARKQGKLDVKLMHAVKIPKEEPLVDDGKGKIKVWRVEDYERVDTNESEYGHFYTGDAYVILYTYIWKNVERYIIYFYQGRDATITDSGAAALLTVGLDDSLNRQAKEVRVVQGKEPKHFLIIFKGKIILHQGQDPNGLGKKYEGPALYDVRGNNDLNIKAVQIFPNTNMLHHCHVFIAMNNRYQKDGQHFIWCGNQSNTFERNFAVDLLSSQGYTNVQVLEQGAENEQFWDILGGESIYYDKNPDVRVTPRLFQCCEASGIITVEEILNFFQDDLAGDDVMILDAFSEMYVWAGKMSTEGERKTGMQMSLEYAATATDSRPKKVTAYYLREGDETLQFAIHFQGFQWQPRHRMASMPMPDPLDFPPVLKPLGLVSDMLGQYDRYYTYDELLNKKYPKGIDVKKLESYLSDEEFLEVFAVTKQEFEKFPLWKKEGVKKELNLF